MKSELRAILFADGTSLKIVHDNEGVSFETFNVEDEQTGLWTISYEFIAQMTQAQPEDIS